MYTTVSVHEMQQYGHHGLYKVDTFLIKIYTSHTDFQSWWSVRSKGSRPYDVYWCVQCRKMLYAETCRKVQTYVRGLFKKYPTFGRKKKIHIHSWRSATLIPVEVVSLWLNTLLPAVPPLFEAFLECVLASGVQHSRRVPYKVVSWLKSSPFQLRFQVKKQPKIARSHVRRVGSLSNHRNVVQHVFQDFQTELFLLHH
jgi:hypothetical protein